jgi:riboflavin synthase
MFTGLVEKGTVVSLEQTADGSSIAIKVPKWGQMPVIGDSVAVDGTCLTVNSIAEDIVGFFASTETLSKTILGNYRQGTAVNLELPLLPNSFLGGHYVLGHVDCTGTVAKVDPSPTAWFISINIPEQFNKYVVYKGSVAINGVSLTINEVSDTLIHLCIIPVTLEKTNLKELNPGTTVNIEFDILAKYTEKLLMSKK